MTNAMLAVFGFSGGELMMVLLALFIGGMVLVGIGVLTFLISRTISKKSEPANPGAGKQ